MTASSEARPREEQIDSISFEVLPFWWTTLWFRIPALCTLMLLMAYAVRTWSLRRLRRKLQKLQQEQAIEQERTRIARNIHDDVGASLTRISLLTQVAPQADAYRENMNRIYATTREITRSLDEIVWAINPQYDSVENFIGYLADYAQNFLAVAGIRCRLDIPELLLAAPLNSQARHHLFMAAREALTNVVKHAKAHEVILRLRTEPAVLTISIIDDGVGIRVGPKPVESDRLSGGQGLGNISARLNALNGRASFESSEKGTTVVLSVPFSPDKDFPIT